MEVSMTNPKTGEIRGVKIGWSWILFLFSSIFGLPLFLRKLHIWGGIFLIIQSFNILSLTMDISVFIIFAPLVWGLSIWLGKKGNEMTAKNYLELGWNFSNPDSDKVKYTKTKWGITI